MWTKPDEGWNPYLAGALAGLILVISVFLTGKYFGASTTFVRSAGLIEKTFAPDHVAKLAYFTEKTPKIDWQFMFVLGIFIGAFVSSVASKTFQLQGVPYMWEERFGISVLKRAAAAFLGGFIAIFGARLAGGCPSGHGLSGLAQLSVSGMIAAVCFFSGGIITAKILYRGGKR